MILRAIVQVILLLILGAVAHAQPVPPTGCTTTTCTGAALPTGYLSVVGNQLQNSPGSNVRPACTVFRGLPTDNMAPIRNAGFNCIEIGWRDAYTAAAQTTWNPSDQTGMTFSNSNLTVTSGASGVFDVRSTSSKTTGKFCWEVTASTISVDFGVGLSNSSYVLGNTTGLGGEANGYGFYAGKANPNAQISFYNGNLLTSGTAAASVNGEKITECHDFDAQLDWVTDSAMRTNSGAGAWNNSGSCNPTVAACGLSTSGLAGALFVAYHNRETGAAVLNALGPFAVALPSGFQVFDQGSTAPAGCNSTAQIAACVSAAQAANLDVILNHLGNEVPGSATACVGRQQNGLWFDQGGSSGNDDGCGDGHNWSYAGFKANTVALLQQFNGNPTVIGYEFHNEPLIKGSATGTGGGGGAGSFSVTNGVIKDPAGNTWLARGLNMFDSQMTSGNSSVTQTQSLFPHLNFVRLAIGDDNCTDLSITNCNQSIASIETGISTFTTKGIVMMVDPHVGGGGQNASGVNLYNEAKFLGQIAADLKADPYVWIESGNELNAAGLTTEHVNVYNAARNAGAPWATSASFPNHAIRNNGGNLYIQTAGATGSTASVCTSAGSGSGPTGTGSGIGDNTCRWDFVSTYTAAAAGGAQPIVVFNPPNGGNPGAQPDGPLSAYNSMTNIVIDQHRYNWSVYAFYNRGNGQSISQAESDTEWGNTVSFQQGVYVPASSEGKAAVIAAETGYIDYVGGDQNNCINCNSSYIVVDSALRMTGGASGFAQWLWHWDGGQPSTDATNQAGTARTQNGDNTNTVGIAPGPAPARVSGTGGSGNPPINWGGGGDTDLMLACGDVGAAVNAVNAGVVLFCPGPVNNTGTTLLSGVSKTFSATATNNVMDLSLAASKPVTGLPASKIAYSVHVYPDNVAGATPDTPLATMVPIWNAYFGSLVRNGTAPVLNLATGCACDGSNGNLTDDQAFMGNWVSYANGIASGGPAFTGAQQPMGNGWYSWGNFSGQNPNGILNADSSLKGTATGQAGGQAFYWSQLLYSPAQAVTPQTTWNGLDKATGITLSNNNLTATSTVATPVSVRATTSRSTGKQCFAATAGTITSNWTIGLANSTYNLTLAAGLGGDTNSIGFDPNSTGGLQGIFFGNSRLSSGAATSANGETAMICADLDAHLFWATDSAMRTALGSGVWNNTAGCNPTNAGCGVSFSGLTGPYFPTYNNFETGSAATLGTTTAAMPFSVPTGFNTWDLPITGGKPIILIMGANDNQPQPANDDRPQLALAERVRR